MKDARASVSVESVIAFMRYKHIEHRSATGAADDDDGKASDASDEQQQQQQQMSDRESAVSDTSSASAAIDDANNGYDDEEAVEIAYATALCGGGEIEDEAEVMVLESAGVDTAPLKHPMAKDIIARYAHLKSNLDMTYSH